MTRGCALCQKTPTTKCGCGLRLCADHDSVLKHDCEYAKKLDAIASDPKKRREWLKDNAHENSLTTEMINLLNREVQGFFWRTKRAQGKKSSDDADGVLDVTGIAAPEGIAVYLETKSDHRDECACPWCARQRDFAARANGAGAIAILGIRTARAGVDAVRMALARARGRAA